jgi:hypothetical protein
MLAENDESKRYRFIIIVAYRWQMIRKLESENLRC